MSSAMPTDYESWKYCITIKCKIPLTPDYVNERIRILTDTKHAETKEFVKLYGVDYHERIVNWFKRAQTELSRGAADSAIKQ